MTANDLSNLDRLDRGMPPEYWGVTEVTSRWFLVACAGLVVLELLFVAFVVGWAIALAVTS